MPSAHIVKSVPIIRSPRVIQVEGIFDIPPSERSQEEWHVSLPLEEMDWNIGLIVGPSGCGKTTIARALFGDAVCTGFDWPEDACILDGFPAEMGIKEIVALLSSVGFSSPPLWLRPFRVLSTGQQMRVNVARLLAEKPDLAVMDEFTSTVDRTVAQIGSAAIAKAVRRRGQKFVAVTCHYDVVDWLQPDWVYQPHLNEFLPRSPTRHPPITLTVRRVHPSAWELFRQYHYLDQSFNKSAKTFVAFLEPEGTPVALQAVLPMAGRKNMYRGHRAVCLPDYQGVGIGNALITYVASAYRAIGARILSITANFALAKQRMRDPRWKLLYAPHLSRPSGKTGGLEPEMHHATNRLVMSWEYVGPPMDLADARALLYG